ADHWRQDCFHRSSDASLGDSGHTHRVLESGEAPAPGHVDARQCLPIAMRVNEARIGYEDMCIARVCGRLADTWTLPIPRYGHRDRRYSGEVGKRLAADAQFFVQHRIGHITKRPMRVSVSADAPDGSIKATDVVVRQP